MGILKDALKDAGYVTDEDEKRIEREQKSVENEVLTMRTEGDSMNSAIQSLRKRHTVLSNILKLYEISKQLGTGVPPEVIASLEQVPVRDQRDKLTSLGEALDMFIKEAPEKELRDKLRGMTRTEQVMNMVRALVMEIELNLALMLTQQKMQQ